jgi:putative transport protein
MDTGIARWLVDTLRAYPELAVFFALAVGFGIGAWKVGGFTLGTVTATLLAGVLIGQLGITVGGPIKSTFFLMFLFAAGLYAGSQTISAAIGVATDQIDRLGLDAAQAKAYVDAVPIGYAVTYTSARLARPSCSRNWARN